MSRIFQLKPEVYGKIAAGEVIERPVSVVKELVENSIDAGADEISIQLLAAGKIEINISDNGEGFNKEDLPIAFKRHATSKLKEIEDFNSLNTMGFRGEALPSILEVSKIELITSDNDEGEAWHCFYHNSKLQEIKPSNRVKGTTIIVKDLFYNFPVRKKFLKSHRSELNLISAFIEETALCRPNIAFSLSNDGKLLFDYSKVTDIGEKIYQVLGKNILNKMQKVEFELEDYKIKGYVSKLTEAIKNKRSQHFFVNKRPVKERTIIASLNNSFKPYLEKSLSPRAILFLEIPPSDIDVNIHPMKLEVKFTQNDKVYSLVKRAIDSQFRDIEAGYSTIKTDKEESSSKEENYYSTSLEQRLPIFSNSDFTEPKSEDLFKDNYEEIYNKKDEEEKKLPQEEFRIIGQLFNSYILVEKGDNLFVVDQHNAQERINFNKLKEQYEKGEMLYTAPLFPLLIEFSISESAMLEDSMLKELKETGFHLEPMGGRTYEIKKFPVIIKEKDIESIIKNIIEIKNNKEEKNYEDKILATIACKSSIKANTKLHHLEMFNLVKELLGTKNPDFCPHHRPVIITYSLEEIEKKLKRR